MHSENLKTVYPKQREMLKQFLDKLKEIEGVSKQLQDETLTSYQEQMIKLQIMSLRRQAQEIKKQFPKDHSLMDDEMIEKIAIEYLRMQ